MTKTKPPAIKNRIVGHGDEPLDSIVFNPKNWRIHPKGQQDGLAGVLADVGWVQQVIINKRTGNLVDGHLRVQLADKAGEKTIPVVYVDLSEAEEAEVLATLDPIGAMAATDKAKLGELFREIETGNAEVQQLLAEIADKEYLWQETSKPRSPVGYNDEGSPLEFWPKIAHRLEAVAWADSRGRVLELYAGRGQLSWWYRRLFDEVDTVDKQKFDGVQYICDAAKFCKKQMAKEYDFIDFDDEGCPSTTISAFFEVAAKWKREQFVIAVTDGLGLNLKCRGRYNPYHCYRLGDGKSRQATANDYDNWEDIFRKGMARIADEQGFRLKEISQVRKDNGNIIYACYVVEKSKA